MKQESREDCKQFLQGDGKLSFQGWSFLKFPDFHNFGIFGGGIDLLQIPCIMKISRNLLRLKMCAFYYFGRRFLYSPLPLTLDV